MNSSPELLSIRSFIVVLLLVFSAPSFGQVSTPAIDSRLRNEVVENIVQKLRVKYVAPEKVKDIESALRTKLQNGGYDKTETPAQFSAALTQDLRAAGNDLHLFVTYDPSLEKKSIHSHSITIYSWNYPTMVPASSDFIT